MFLSRGVRRCFLQKRFKTLVPEKKDEGVSLLVEPNTDEFSEAGGVVVPNGLGVAVRLQHRVRLDHLVFQRGLLLLSLLDLLASVGADEGKVGDDLLGVLCLSGSRLSGDKDGLVDARVVHALIGSLGNTKDVGPALGPPLADVDLHGAEGVDGEPLVRVDGDTEEARVGVDQLVLVPDDRVPENAGVSEEGEISHVLRAVKLQRIRLESVWTYIIAVLRFTYLGGVDLADRVCLICLHLSIDIHRQFLPCREGVVLDIFFGDALEVAADLLVSVGHPHALLRVVGLCIYILSLIL